MKWKFKTNQFVSSIPTEFQWFQPFSGEFSMNPNWRNNHNGLDPKGQLLASDNDIMAPAPAGVGFNADLVTSAAAVANKHRANSQHPWICPYRLYHIEWYGAVSVHLKWTQLQMFQIQVRSVWIERMFSSICPYHLICCTCPYFHSPCHRTKTSTQFCFWGKNDWTPSHTALRTRVSIWLVIQKCSGELCSPLWRRPGSPSGPWQVTGFQFEVPRCPNDGSWKQSGAAVQRMEAVFMLFMFLSFLSYLSILACQSLSSFFPEARGLCFCLNNRCWISPCQHEHFWHCSQITLRSLAALCWLSCLFVASSNYLARLTSKQWFGCVFDLPNGQIYNHAYVSCYHGWKASGERSFKT